MIPISLKVKGLYSYKENQEIDFTKLTEASIFGIFGKVGSGKSSILEAITFALYGDTERMNKSGDDRNYNMMNLRSDDMLIDFTCAAGKDNNQYRFVVKGKRNSKNFNDVRTFERSSYEWNKEVNDWSPILVDDAAEKIIGLSYENFKRTIIIPQGKFQEFIELSQSKRTQMMNDIFQLEKYDLAPKVKVLKDANDQQMLMVQAKISQIGEISEEQLNNIQLAIAQTKQQIQTETIQLKALQEHENKLINLQKTFDLLETLKREIEKSEAQKDIFAEKNKRLQKYQSCLIHFKPLLDQENNKKADYERIKLTLEQKNKEANLKKNQLESSQKQLQEIQQKYQDKDKNQAVINDYEYLIQISKNSERIAELTTHIERGKNAVDEHQKQIFSLKNEKAQIVESLTKGKSNKIDLQEAYAVENWFAKKDFLANNLQKSHLEITENESKTKSLKTYETELIGHEIFKGIEAVGFDEKVIWLEKSLENELEKGNQSLLEWNTRQALMSYADALNDGEPCPLCGSVHHPEKLSNHENIEQHLAHTKQQIAALIQKQQSLRSLKNEWQRLQHDKLNLADTLDISQKKHIEIQQESSQHQQAFIWQNFNSTDIAEVKNKIEQAKANQLFIEKQEENLSKTELNLNSIQEKLEQKILPAIRKIEDEFTTRNAENDLLKQQIKYLNFQEFAHIPFSEIEKQKDLLLIEIAETNSLFEKLSSQTQQLKEVQLMLGTEIELLQSNLKQHQQSLETLANKIEEQLIKFAYPTKHEVEAILAGSLDIQAEQQAIEAFNLHWQSVLKQKNELERSVEGQVYDSQQHQLLKQQIQEITNKIADEQKKEGSLNQQAAKLQNDLAQQAILLKQKHQLESRSANLETLTKLFKGQGFVSYVSAMYLQNLCNQANTRFQQMTHYQLQLEIYEPRPSEYDFQVRDLLNEGKTRGVKTLSGGQKFQVALSLALALADNIHAQTQQQHNFFFLDEGFGSLDKDSLVDVFETLKSLRKENRIVGIISHLEELQQEIDRYLLVRNDEELGSLVEIK